MTREGWAAISKEQKCIKVAELCGWTDLCTDLDNWFGKKNGKFALIPDYLNDLNAIHEAEAILTQRQRERYCSFLKRFGISNYGMCCATAAQRAEAFVLTMESEEA